ncbi:MAG TPA: hypothetical protein VJ144_01420, partial [Candidatus Polarisedimenticolia bacterium]|nr:hypothetical protein [Candidatus Polarisedimenticolia bacterium]
GERARRFRCDLLVNATSVGLAPDAERTPVPASWIAAPLVYDIVYNPPETRFLKEARALGAGVIGGIEMFVAQGAAQFRLFTGREAPLDVMRRTVLEALGPAGPPGEEGRPPSRRPPVRGRSRRRKAARAGR